VTTIALLGGGILLGLAALPVADVLLERMDRSYARGSRNLQIWADVRGSEVLLLQTDDALRFGQIYRALQRALERGERAPAR
jgi:predicted nucleic acid-binding protein